MRQVLADMRRYFAGLLPVAELSFEVVVVGVLSEAAFEGSDLDESDLDDSGLDDSGDGFRA